MKPIRTILAILAVGAAAAACSSKPESKQDMLADSGFKIVSLKTPGQAASFKKLPPHKLTRKTYQGKTVWLYADPTMCGCLYMGTQDAYNAYIKEASRQMIAQAMKANYQDDPYSPTAMDAQVDSDWDWGEWGNPGYYGLPY
ncbi:MAG: hypothetical protein LCH93_09880 [Proteobacteria bacterium]|jgi:hypothetical protein|uniref:hypothetical protein n=1 Tax=Reyranella massiliensis TaxID=445220 RepID=UPI0002F771A3|nr:hypothetical protein [Reyranella massiliensis]MCA0246914.1 hypothetical protein [Pseudomonadota bacterium]